MSYCEVCLREIVRGNLCLYHISDEEFEDGMNEACLNAAVSLQELHGSEAANAFLAQMRDGRVLK